MSKSVEEFLKDYQEELMKQQYLRYLEYKAKPSQKAKKNKQVAAAEALAAAPPAAPITDNEIIALKKRGRNHELEEAAVAAPVAC